MNWRISRQSGTNKGIKFGIDITPKSEVFDIGTARLISVGAENGRSDVPGALSTLHLNITYASTDGKGDITVSCQDLGDDNTRTCPTIALTSRKNNTMH